MYRRLRFSAALFLLAGGAYGQTPPSAFVDVNVVSMRDRNTSRHQTVIIADGRIKQIGPNSTIEVPPGARKISGAHRYLLPGLIDMHAHFVRRPSPTDGEVWNFPDYAQRNEDFGLLFVANGVTTIREMNANPPAALRAADADWLGPRIYSTGPITDGDPPIWPMARIIRTAEEAAQAVASDKAAGYLGIKVYDNLPLPLYDSIVAAAAQARLDVVGHVPDAVGLAHAIASHQATIEHTDSFVLSLQPKASPSAPPADLSWHELVHRADLSKMPAFADAMRRAGTWTCPTIVVLQMDSTGGAWADDMAYLPRAYAKKLQQRYAGQSATYDEELAFALAVVSALHRGGAGLLLGSDAAKFNVVPGFSAIHELDYLIRAGLTPYEALQSGTIHAARALHAEDRLGTVEVGKQADLLLIDENPLVDVHNVAKRAGVMLRGRWLPEAELQTRLSAVRQRVQSTP